VGLDLLASAPAMAALAATKVAPQVILRDLEAGRQPFDDHGQLGPMRLPCREPAESCHSDVGRLGRALFEALGPELLGPHENLVAEPLRLGQRLQHLSPGGAGGVDLDVAEAEETAQQALAGGDV